MYHNLDNAYRQNLRHLDSLRKEAQMQRVLRSAKSSYRLRLAQSLQRLADWLEPDAEREVRRAIR